MQFLQRCGAAPVARRFSMSMGVVLAAGALGGCVSSGVDEQTTGSIAANRSAAYSASERECLERAIYFESNRSSQEGMVAVGTVVMNRVASPEFPDTICDVVGQKNQFAPGVLSRHMPREKVPDIVVAAEKVLDGYRHPELDNAMFFHMAGLTFPYDNMHYQLVAGGNAFYEKR
jgi:spore germination cell wall hydrolase CwlJ-like protein